MKLITLDLNRNDISECTALTPSRAGDSGGSASAEFAIAFQERNRELIEESRLREMEIVIIGLGSGGSKISESLVRCGAGRLTLADFDTVSAANPCRSQYDVADIGAKKTAALADRLRRINPAVELTLIDRDILELSTEELERLIAGADLIIEGTDNVRTKILVNGLAFHKVPVIYPGVYDQGKGGEILITLPGLTPCYECVMSSILPQMKEVKRGDWDYTTGGTKPLAGLNADIEIVAARVVKIALGLLLEGTEKAFLERVAPLPERSILFIGNEANFFLFDEPFQEVWAETEVDPECWCQRRNDALVPERPRGTSRSGELSAHDEPTCTEVLSEPEEGAGAPRADE